MEAVDRKILAELQHEGRITVTELAGRLPLSVSRCQRRLRALEARGVVRGYRADVDPAAVGLGFTAIVFVTMQQEDQRTIAAFEAQVAAVPAIVSAQRWSATRITCCASSRRISTPTAASTTSSWPRFQACSD
jgi:DNA-binding Lrp family transcriptional regulator